MGIEEWFIRRRQQAQANERSNGDDSQHTLQDLFEVVPTDLEAYFKLQRDEPITGRYLNFPCESECVKSTKHFLEFEPLIIATKAVYLDDPNTSNHHFYLPDLPLAGSILYLDHDGDTRIVFRSLQEMISAARVASEKDCFLDELHADRVFLAENQDRLNATITRIYKSLDEGDHDAALLLFVASSDFSDARFFETLAADDNFYYGEAIAKSILARPDPRLLSIAEVCQAHNHPQVASPGDKAVKAIRNLIK